MKNLSRRQRNNIIIASLCAILVLMGIGYAAFASQLKINGTSSISSNFSVLITNIESGSIVGGASNATEPTHTNTTATFSTNLVSPGDSITYTITVANQGTIDATLTGIDVNTNNNQAIEFETSGIREGDNLLQGESAELYVKVTYSNSVTSQPENTSSTITVTLNYEQATGATIPSGPTMGGQDVEIVSSGDGLYEDSTRPGRYVYKGANPDNYITFNGETWRIVAKETDGTYKIVRNELLTDYMPFDEDNYRGAQSNGAGGTYCANSSYGCNAWAATVNLVGQPAEFTNTTQTGTVLLDASLNTYLNGTYYNSLSAIARSQIVSHEWGVGVVEMDNADLATQIEGENSYQWNGHVGLLSHSDYLRANSDMLNCGTDKINFENYQTCRNLDWLYISGSNWWLLSPNSNDSNSVWIVGSGGPLSNGSANREDGVRPAVYLNSNLTLTGSGTLSDPFVPVG